MAKPGRAPVSAADTAEVARVLAARDDNEVLGVQPGASSAAARRRYREMAVALHPDKCRVSQLSNLYCAFENVRRKLQCRYWCVRGSDDQAWLCILQCRCRNAGMMKCSSPLYFV